MQSGQREGLPLSFRRLGEAEVDVCRRTAPYLRGGGAGRGGAGGGRGKPRVHRAPLLRFLQTAAKLTVALTCPSDELCV